MPTIEYYLNRITILLVACLLVGCSAEQQEQADFYISTDADCSAPCWHGISPGRSTMIEAESILRSLPFTSELRFDASSTRGIATACWQITPVMSSGCATFKDTVLQHLRLRPKNLHLGEVIDKIGVPDHIIAGYQPTERVDYVIDLYYPAKGVVISVIDSPMGALSDAQRITRDLKVGAVQYFEPMDLKTFLIEVDGRSEDNAQRVLDHLQAWPGYGPNVIQVEK